MQNKPTIESIELFPFFRAFFCNDGVWETLTDKAKLQHAFMLNRYLSIKHAQYIQNFNKFHNVHVINALHEDFKSKGKSPGWMYTKTTDSTVTKHKLSEYSSEIINMFCKGHDIEFKSLEFLCEIMPLEIYAELDEMKKQLAQTVKPKKR